jgi:hypothetical protein
MPILDKIDLSTVGIVCAILKCIKGSEGGEDMKSVVGGGKLWNPHFLAGSQSTNLKAKGLGQVVYLVKLKGLIF